MTDLRSSLDRFRNIISGALFVAVIASGIVAIVPFLSEIAQISFKFGAGVSVKLVDLSAVLFGGVLGLYSANKKTH